MHGEFTCGFSNLARSLSSAKRAMSMATDDIVLNEFRDSRALLLLFRGLV